MSTSTPFEEYLQAQVTDLQAQVTAKDNEIVTLRDQFLSSELENQGLKHENQGLKNENDALKKERDDLKSKIAEFEAIKKEKEELQQEIKVGGGTVAERTGVKESLLWLLAKKNDIADCVDLQIFVGVKSFRHFQKQFANASYNVLNAQLKEIKNTQELGHQSTTKNIGTNKYFALVELSRKLFPEWLLSEDLFPNKPHAKAAYETHQENVNSYCQLNGIGFKQA